jgi:hypothetical protein
LLHHLKGAPLPFPETGVTSYGRGVQEPVHRTDWPPATLDRTLTLVSGTAATAPCAQRHLVERDVEAHPGTPVTYRYNPLKPWPSEGGARGLGMKALVAGTLTPGPVRQTWDCARQDVLRFVAPASPTPQRIAGRMLVKLRVQSTAKDTAFYAKLVDLDERDRAVHVTDGAATLRLPTSRDEQWVPYTPGETRDVELELLPTEWVLQPGHRFGLWVSSSNYPALSAHLNTETPWFATREPLLATQTVFLDGPSALILRVVPDRQPDLTAR